MRAKLLGFVRGFARNKWPQRGAEVPDPDLFQAVRNSYAKSG